MEDKINDIEIILNLYKQKIDELTNIIQILIARMNKLEQEATNYDEMIEDHEERIDAIDNDLRVIEDEIGI